MDITILKNDNRFENLSLDNKSDVENFMENIEFSEIDSVFIRMVNSYKRFNVDAFRELLKIGDISFITYFYNKDSGDIVDLNENRFVGVNSLINSYSVLAHFQNILRHYQQGGSLDVKISDIEVVYINGRKRKISLDEFFEIYNGEM